MRIPVRLAIVFGLLLQCITPSFADMQSESTKLKLEKTITGDISPKSVRASRTGYVSAHNMMYRHSVTIYDANSLDLITTIPDSVKLSDFGVSGYSGIHRGAPVEGAYSPDGNISTSPITPCTEKVLIVKELMSVILPINTTAHFYIGLIPQIGK